MIVEYWRQPDVTVETFRNFWFHTGDLAYIDEHGLLLNWTDRKKDAIRRRGEMISSIVVENAATAHPGVGEAAVFGVPGRARRGGGLPLRHRGGRRGRPRPRGAPRRDGGLLPAFAVPRYIAQLESLPRSATLKIDKKALKAEGETRGGVAGPSGAAARRSERHALAWIFGARRTGRRHWTQ